MDDNQDFEIEKLKFPNCRFIIEPNVFSDERTVICRILTKPGPHPLVACVGYKNIGCPHLTPKEIRENT